MTLVDDLLKMAGTTRFEIQKKRGKEKKKTIAGPSAIRTPKAPTIKSITRLAKKAGQAQKERQMLQKGVAPVVSTFKKQAQRRIIDPFKAFDERTKEVFKAPPGAEAGRRDIRIGFLKSFPATIVGSTELVQKGLAAVTGPAVKALGGQVPTVKRPEFLKKITEATNENQQAGMIMGDIVQFFLPQGQIKKIFDAIQKTKKLSSMPVYAQKLLKTLSMAAVEGTAGGAIAAGQEGELNRDVAMIAALSAAAPIVIPLIGKALGKVKFKNIKVSPEGVKKGVQNILSDGAFKATPVEIKAGKVALDDAAAGVRKLNDALRKGATVKEKRNFVNWVRDLFKKTDDPTPEIKAFLAETTDIATVSDDIVGSYQQRALDLVKPAPVFAPRATGLAKGIIPPVTTAEQRLVGFAKPVPKEIELTKAEKLIDKVTLGATKQKDIRNKLTERMLKASDEIIPPEIKLKLKEDPSSFHDVISRNELVTIIEELPEAEMKILIEFGDPNIATVSAALLKRRLREEGRIDEMFDYIKKGQELSVLSARGLEAQKTWLEFLTPEEKLLDIKNRLAETELKLIESQEKKLIERFEEVDRTFKNVKDIKEKAINTTTKEAFEKNLKKYNKVVDEFINAKRNAEKDITLILPKKVADMAVSALQAGFLSIKSLLANPIYNIVFGTLESASKSTALIGDAAFSKIAGRERAIFTGSLKESFKGATQGTKRAFTSILKGPTKKQIRGKVDSYRGLQPIRAMADVATKEFMPVDIKTGKPRLSTNFNRLVEGYTGTLSEPVFRGLVLGDMPFLESARRNFLASKAKELKLKGLEKQKFIEFPPEKSAKEAEKFARIRVFQQENKFSNTINDWIDKVGDIPGVGGALKFVARANVPFVRTPVNAFINIIDYVKPEIAFAKFLYHTSKGNREAAFMSLGRMTIGIVLGTVSGLLVENNIYKGDEFVSEKQRKLDYATHPPGTINIKALTRWLIGGDPSYQKGDDVFVSDQRMGALGGSLQVQDSIKSTEEAREKGFDKRGIEFEEDMLSRIGMYLNNFGTLGTFALEETFIGEAANVLSILKDADSAQGRSKFNRWLVKMWQATTTVAMPNSVAAFSKAATLNLKDPDFALKFAPLTMEEKIKIADNIFRERIFEGETLPDIVDLYGRPVPRVPKGTNPFIAAIDPIGFKGVGEDAVIKQMYDLFIETGDSGIIPAIPGKEFSVEGEKHLLNTDEKYLEYYAITGGEQRKLAEQLINSTYFKNLPVEAQVDIWKKIHKEGKEKGQAIYLGDAPSKTSTLDLYQYANLTPNASRRTYGAYMLETGQTINKNGNAPLDEYRTYVETSRLLQHGMTQDEYVASTINVFSNKEYSQKTVEIKLKTMKAEGKVDSADIKNITTSLFGAEERADTGEVDRLIKLIDNGGLKGPEITTAINKFEATNNYTPEDIEALRIHYQL